MTRALEKSICNQIIRFLKTLPDCWFMRTEGGPYGRKGVPDIVGCLYGKMFALEVKRIGGKATKLQLHELEKIRAAGGRTGIVHSVDEVKEVLRIPNDID